VKRSVRNRSISNTVRWLAVTALVAFGAYSCGNEPAARVVVAPAPPDQGFMVEDSSFGAGGQPVADEQCLNEGREALPVGLDIYVMLDSSLSMKDLLPQTPGSTQREQDKWTAVQRSLEAFLEAPETADIGVGLQYFPQVVAGVPFSCSDNLDCGAAGGACSTSRCVQDGSATLQSGQRVSILTATQNDSPCLDDSECTGAGQSCKSLVGQCIFRTGDLDFPQGSLLPAGVPALCSGPEDCAAFAGAVCEEIGVCEQLVGGSRVSCSRSVACPAGGGQCVKPTHVCTKQKLCNVEEYATPAVPIRNDPDRAADIVASLAAVDPVGPTPTGPALQGALEQAKGWAQAHQDRQVITVLVTDGFPTDCSPIANTDVAAIAQEANRGAQPIHTFVVGVFSTQDLGSDGVARLDELARAGGSEKSFVINTASDVSGELLRALNEIRDSSARCNFPLDSTSLDLNRVNLEVLDGAGTTTQLLNVSNAAGCGADQDGWFYESAGKGGARQLTVCPSTCRKFISGSVSANLQIGCATRIR
jgi:hypothetical protein